MHDLSACSVQSDHNDVSVCNIKAPCSLKFVCIISVGSCLGSNSDPCMTLDSPNPFEWVKSLAQIDPLIS